MKVKFKYGIGSYSGTLDMATFYETKRGGASFMRKWVMPRATEQNTILAKKSTNISNIWKQTSGEYKDDMETYCNLYEATGPDAQNPFHVKITSYAMFTRMMYKFEATSGDTVDLVSLSFGDITTLFPELTTIAASCAVGVLVDVPGADLLTKEM